MYLKKTTFPDKDKESFPFFLTIFQFFSPFPLLSMLKVTLFFYKNTKISVEPGCAYFSEDFQPQMFLLTFWKNYLTWAIVYHPKKKYFRVLLLEIWKKGFIGPIFYLKTDTRKSFSCLNNQTLSDFLNLRLTLFLRCQISAWMFL